MARTASTSSASADEAKIEALVEERVTARLAADAEAAAAAKRASSTIVRKPVARLDLCSPAIGSTDGYGNMAQHLAIELEKLGLHVRIVGMPARYEPIEDAAEKLFDRSRTDNLAGDAILFIGQPCGSLGTGGWMPQRDRVAYGWSMFEADDLPPVWRQGLSRVHEVWVPSDHSAEIFRRHVPEYVGVHTIPLGVDTAAFAPARRKRGDKLRILFHCSHAKEYRKGADLAIEAFLQAFPGREDVELYVHSAYAPIPLERRDVRVRFEIGRLTSAALAELYRSASALLYPSRGEGFGLIPLEAMATGMPAIYAPRTGMATYGAFGLTVGARPVPSRIGVGRGDVDAGLVEANWYEPALDELVARLREVDEQYEAVQDRAFEQAAEINERWSWAACAAAVKARLDCGEPLRIMNPIPFLAEENRVRGIDVGHVQTSKPRF